MNSSYYIRVYDPIGLAAKEKEIRKLQEQIYELMERQAELRQERKFHLRPRRQKRKAAQ